MRTISEKTGCISSWSGGKDSCFACYKALQSGYRITGLVNFISKQYKRVSFHGTEAGLIQIQSELSGIPLYQKETTPENYEKEFKDALLSLSAEGISEMVFGDIYLEEHRQWVERVCGELGIEPIEPLWKNDTEEHMKDFLDRGFRAVVVSGQAKHIDREWIGQPVDREFIKYLKAKPEVDICGENGEYHTLVLSGPLFDGDIEITDSEVIRRDGYWFLDIKEYKVIR
jgi:uncharacterized protein (TIGR00290 family)